MNIIEHNLIMIEDENGENIVEDFIKQLSDESLVSQDAKLHLQFLSSAFNLLSVQPLDSLINSRTEMTISINGEQRTKSYQLVKPLRVVPVYELRYAMNRNEHLRFLFFPFEYEGESNYVFVKCFIKTRIPNVDETDRMRDLTYQMYQRVKANPVYYLEGMGE